MATGVLKQQALVVCLGCALCFCPVSAPADEPVRLWPGEPPGNHSVRGPEQDQTGPKGNLVAGEKVIRLGNVSTPTITVYSPDASKNTGAAVMVCPGGGYHILAWDLEGTEVCQWLNSIGVTGVLLKYRVPRKAGERIPAEPLMDVQRAMSLTRQNAEKWGIQPDRIGVLGFSAGGNLAARLSTQYNQRAYAAIDDTDAISCRPDFAVLIYPAYFYDAKSNKREPWVHLPVTDKTPPMFLTMAFDDPVGPENILRMGLALKEKGVPAEVHLYPTGGHGYGLRPSEYQATTWPDRCAAWMQANGWLDH